MTYSFSDTNRSFVRYIKEVQWGQTPATGTSRVASMTSHNLTTKKNTTISNTIRRDRLVQDIIATEIMSDGGINFEFSAGAIDDYLEAFMMGTWTRPMTFDSVVGSALAWTANNIITITSATDYSTTFLAGRRIKTEGFVNPTNNLFTSISSISFASGVTTITVTTTSGVVEAGSIKAKLQDANDVIILNSTAIRSGTSGASSFDSNSGNAFASAIAAGQLAAGQKIHVEGLGYETGTFTIASGGVVAATTFTISDGTSSYAFTAGTDFTQGVSGTTAAAALAVAVNNARVNGIGAGAGLSAVFPKIKATASAGTLTLVNLNGTGGSLAKFEPTGTNVTVTAFSGGNLTQHGVYTITSLNSDQLFVTPAPATNANGGSLAVTIRGSMLRNPLPANIIPQSFTLESGYDDVSKYITSDGQRVQDFTLDVNAAAIVTGAIAFMGRATITQNTDVLGLAPYVALQNQGTEIMNATTDVGAVTKNGAALSTAVKQIKIDGKAMLRNQMAVGSKYPVGIGTGRFELTGSIQAYFDTFELFANFLNHDTVSLNFSLTDTAGLSYYWGIPAVKLTADPIHAKGIDQDVMEEITFSALRDPVTQTMMQIDRFSSLLPV